MNGDAQTALIILGALYFLPAISAYARGHMSAAGNRDALLLSDRPRSAGLAFPDI
jgi:hypothetical protein